MKMRANIVQILIHCLIIPMCLGLFLFIVLSFFLGREIVILVSFLLVIATCLFQVLHFIVFLSIEENKIILKKLTKTSEFLLNEVEIRTEIKITNFIFKEQKLMIRDLEKEYDFDLSLMSFFKFRKLQNSIKNGGGIL